MRISKLAALAFMVVMVLSLSFTIAAQTDYQPVATSDACPFYLPEGEVEGTTIECGYLTVPQDRNNLDEIDIELAYAILYASGNQTVTDPIIYLEGGPGGSALSGVDLWVDSPFRESRDIILLDQRGSGYSYPRLICYEMDEIDETLDDDAYMAATGDAIAACRAGFEAEGIDISDYHSATNAADVHDLAVALGYQSWNLYGISYGTRLALTVMRDVPEGLRSVVLDSTYPPSVDAYEESPANTYRVLQQLFTDCAADAACNAAYPNLENRFLALVDRLNANPAELPDDEGVLSGGDLVYSMVDYFYSTALLPYLPMMIDEIDNGEFSTYLGIEYGEIPPFEDGGDDVVGGDSDITIDDELVSEFVDEFYYLTDGMDDDTYYEFYDALYETPYWEDFSEILYDYLSAEDADYLAGLVDQMDDDQLYSLEDALFYSDLDGDLVYLFVDEFYYLTDDMDDDTFYEFYDALYEVPTWDGFVEILPDYLSAEDADYLAELIYEMDEDQLASLEYELFVEDVSDTDGMFDVFECSEELPFNNYDEAVTLSAGIPVQIREGELDGVQEMLDYCDFWNVPARDGIEDLAITSDIPTLVLAGDYDPVTPPAWGEIAAETLSNSYFYLFPGVGHGAIDGGDCPVNIAQAFLDNPNAAPNSDCIAGMRIEFVLP